MCELGVYFISEADPAARLKRYVSGLNKALRKADKAAEAAWRREQKLAERRKKATLREARKKETYPPAAALHKA